MKHGLGLVIGKFYPPHRGHKLLIDTATQQSERAKLYRQGEQLLRDDAGRLFIANNQPPLAFAKRVKGYVPHPTRVCGRTTRCVGWAARLMPCLHQRITETATPP